MAAGSRRVGFEHGDLERCFREPDAENDRGDAANFHGVVRGVQEFDESAQDGGLSVEQGLSELGELDGDHVPFLAIRGTV
ncbi:MAG: hypothetical protein ACK4WH_08285 [Phycisphaerales bacterium]